MNNGRVLFHQGCGDSQGSSCSLPCDNPGGEERGDQTGAVTAAADSPHCGKQDGQSSEQETHPGNPPTATTTTTANPKPLASNPVTECATNSSPTVNASDAVMPTSRQDSSNRPSEHAQETATVRKEEEEQEQHCTPSGSSSEVPQEHCAKECRPSSLQLPDQEWSISFEQFLANVANEENLVSFFEQQVNVAEEVQKLRTRNTISPSASGSVASSPT